MIEWEPIDTAPRDGSPFLGAIWWDDSKEWQILRMEWRDHTSNFVDATYAPFGADQEQPLLWMPLPKPNTPPVR